MYICMCREAKNEVKKDYKCNQTFENNIKKK